MSNGSVTEIVDIGPVIYDPSNPQRNYENTYIFGRGVYGSQEGFAFPMFLVGTLALGAVAAALAPVAIDMAAKAAKGLAKGS